MSKTGYSITLSFPTSLERTFGSWPIKIKMSKNWYIHLLQMCEYLSKHWYTSLLQGMQMFKCQKLVTVLDYFIISHIVSMK